MTHPGLQRCKTSVIANKAARFDGELVEHVASAKIPLPHGHHVACALVSSDQIAAGPWFRVGIRIDLGDSVVNEEISYDPARTRLHVMRHRTIEEFVDPVESC